MKTITVEQVHSKTIDYNDKKTGEAKSFIKYAAASGGTWYELKGRGKDTVKQGDTITGDYSTKDWTQGDKSGTNHILELVDPFLADILKRVEKLEAYVYGMADGKSPKETEKPDVEDNDSLPF